MERWENNEASIVLNNIPLIQKTIYSAPIEVNNCMIIVCIQRYSYQMWIEITHMDTYNHSTQIQTPTPTPPMTHK